MKSGRVHFFNLFLAPLSTLFTLDLSKKPPWDSGVVQLKVKLKYSWIQKWLNESVWVVVANCPREAWFTNSMEFIAHHCGDSSSEDSVWPVRVWWDPLPASQITTFYLSSDSTGLDRFFFFLRDQTQFSRIFLIFLTLQPNPQHQGPTSLYQEDANAYPVVKDDLVLRICSKRQSQVGLYKQVYWLAGLQ